MRLFGNYNCSRHRPNVGIAGQFIGDSSGLDMMGAQGRRQKVTTGYNVERRTREIENDHPEHREKWISQTVP